MPTYDYRCFTCATIATITQPIHARQPNPKCRQCNQPMSRIYQAPGLTFKGTGWAHKESNR